MEIQIRDGFGFINMDNARLNRIVREGQSACPGRPELHTIRLQFDDGNHNTLRLDFSEAEAKNLKEKLNNRKDL